MAKGCPALPTQAICLNFANTVLFDCLNLAEPWGPSIMTVAMFMVWRPKMTLRVLAADSALTKYNLYVKAVKSDAWT